jgi:hypothetical protein
VVSFVQPELFSGGAIDVSDGVRAPVTQPGSETPQRPDVEVRTSQRRRKSATAYWSDGRIVVLLPHHLRGRARIEMIEWLVARVLARRPRVIDSDAALFRRALELAGRYLPEVTPTSVRWVTNQSRRWGSCTAGTGEIRLSHRLQSVPTWVLDAVLVHELAHLVHPDHSPAFYAIANRFPKQKEASHFLDGYALGLEVVVPRSRDEASFSS